MLSNITGDTENSCCRSCSWGVLKDSDVQLSNIFILYFNSHEKGSASQGMYIKKSQLTRLIYTLLGHHDAKTIFLYAQFLAQQNKPDPYLKHR